MIFVYTGRDGCVRWEMHKETHVLEFQGAGPISDFDPFDERFPGWMPLLSQIQEAHIGEGVTRIGDYAFYPYDHGHFYDLQPRLHRVTFPFTLETIGFCAFRANTHIHTIDLSNHTNLRAIDQFAFASCFKAKSVDLSGCTQLRDLSTCAFKGCDELSYLNLQGCTSLSDTTLKILRANIPRHTPIIMPDGRVNCRDFGSYEIQEEHRIFMSPEDFRGLSGTHPA